MIAARGLPLGLASSSPARLIDAALAGLGLDRGQFAAVVSAEREAYGKPHPAVYLRAASALGVEPTRCLALEDSLNGALAAKAARMRCIAVPEVFEGCARGFAIADALLPSLERIDDALFDSIWPRSDAFAAAGCGIDVDGGGDPVAAAAAALASVDAFLASCKAVKAAHGYTFDREVP